MARREEAIDLLLTDAAETLIRNRRRRPNWLPPGFPMKLILSLKRELLIKEVCVDPHLRTRLRASSRRLLDPQLGQELEAQGFADRVHRSSNPHQLIATALVHEEQDIAIAAAPWALHPETIPVCPDHRDRQVRVAEQRGEAPPAMDSKREQPRPPNEVSGGTVALSTQPDRTVTDESSVDTHCQTTEASPAVTSAGEASPVLAVTPSPTHGTAETEQLRHRIRQLEAENLDLRSKVPTKLDRRRQNKQQGQLQRVEAELHDAHEELDALRGERDHLVGLRHELELQLEEAEDARTAALRKSQGLERRLTSTAGRAEYLRRSLDNDISSAEVELEGLSDGPDRTRVNKRLKNLQTLHEVLEICFPAEAAHPAMRSRRAVVGAQLELTVTPLGGGNEIGGSAILVEGGGRRILVDAGLHPDGSGPRDIQQVDGRLDGIVITHAHNDHAGYVPALVDRFRNVPVFCSDATASLLPTMWADSAKVMERSFAEADASVRAAPPLYGAAEVERAEDRIRDRPFQRTFSVGDLSLTLFPAGHILGAAGVVISAGDKRVVITGDISGLEDDYLSVEPANLPGLVDGADLLVIETTYCQDRHTQRKQQEQGLISAVRSVVNRRGRVLIPAFGLGRSQEVLMILRKHLPDVPVLVDGLAKDITAIYEKVAEDSGHELTIIGGQVNPVRNRGREIQSFHSGVIVSTSGMLTGGPSVRWAKEILPDERAALLLCGYQDEEAPGRQLERLVNGQPGRRKLTLPDDELGTVDIEVRATVDKYALSAHADQPALLDIIERVHPRETMLVHGLPDKQAAFRRQLRDRGVATVPTARWQSCR